MNHKNHSIHSLTQVRIPDVISIIENDEVEHDCYKLVLLKIK